MNVSDEADIAAVRRALRQVPAGPDVITSQAAFERLVVKLRELAKRARSEDDTKEVPTP